MRVAAGATFSSLLYGATEGLVDHYGFQLRNFVTDEVAIARTTEGVEELGSGVYRYTGMAPTIGVYYFRWDDGTEEFDDRNELLEVVSEAAFINGGPTFATRADLQQRLGRTLTEGEGGQADFLLVLATGAIAEACDRDLEWAAAYVPVPTMLRILCIEVATRVLLNPQGLKSGSESLGAYSKSGTYADGAGAIELTEREERLARRAVYGTNSASSSPRSVVDRVQDLRESRDVDDIPV